MSDDLPELDTRLAAWVEEAGKLRASLPRVAIEDGPQALHEQLVKSRAVLDRVEAITVMLMKLKGRTHAALVAAKHGVREDEDAAYTSRRVSFDQYATGREREAWAAQASIDTRAKLMKIEQLDINTGTALEVVKMLRWGIDGYRKDADTRLRLMTYERQLER